MSKFLSVERMKALKSSIETNKGKTYPDLTAAVQDLVDSGTEDLTAELEAQAELITELEAAVAGKAAGGETGSGSGDPLLNPQFCSVVVNATGTNNNSASYLTIDSSGKPKLMTAHNLSENFTIDNVIVNTAVIIYTSYGFGVSIDSYINCSFIESMDFNWTYIIPSSDATNDFCTINLSEDN